jgi:hypothetical protein
LRKITPFSKYKNIKTTIDGIKFDSKKEANRYSELKMMQKAGLISDLELQPKFDLLPKIKWNNQTLRKRMYIADFLYKQNGKTIVVDAKGFKTPMYKFKRHMFLIKYPEYVFMEV